MPFLRQGELIDKTDKGRTIVGAVSNRIYEKNDGCEVYLLSLLKIKDRAHVTQS